ncbi:MAG: putative bifunctional diguanylate cyclase/phosphodiesterase [Halothiobacillaceae bacterium]
MNPTSSPHDLLLVIGLAWAAIASLALAGLIWQLWSLRRRLLDLTGGDGSLSPRRSIREAMTHLQAIVAAQHNLLAQTSRTRDQLRDAARSAERLRRQQWAAQQLFARLDEGVFMASHDGKVFEVNPALEDMLQRPAHQMRERRLGDVLAPEDAPFFQNLCGNILQLGHWEGRLVLRRADRSAFPAFLRLLSLLDDAGRPQYLLGVLQDLSPVEETRAQLHQLTHHDPLTGLQNRASFLDEVDAILQADPERHWLLAIIGIDRFTIVNDTLGPHLGNRILVQVAARLRHALQPSERLAHLGGDEFVLLMPLVAPESSHARALERAGTFLESLRRPIELKEPRYTLKLTGSLGMAVFPHDGRRADELVQAAHLALLQAKSSGGDQAALHDASMSQLVTRRFHLEQGLRHALERREIEGFLHPLISAQAGQLEGFECLMRWRHQDGAYVPPEEFIPVAEETGLIIPLTTWLLDQACLHLASWRNQTGKPLFLSLNVSPRQLLDPKLPDLLIRTLHKHRLDPTALMLEITESGLVGSIVLVRERILQLAMRGFLIAVDDFGTGQSTLSLLNELPIDKLKIDQSFIRDRIPQDAEAVKIVEAMLALAKGLQLAVVVEGVETAEQAQFIRQRLPTALLQGFLFGAPQPLHAWDGLLLEGKLPSYDWNKEKGA